MVNVYDIQFLTPTRKEVAVAVLIVFVLLVGAGCIGYCIGIRNVHNHGAGTDIPGVQLEPVIVHQQQLTDGITEAKDTSNEIAGTSQAIAESTNNIADGVNEAAGIIDSCQQLLGRIRNRAEENKVTH